LFTEEVNLSGKRIVVGQNSGEILKIEHRRSKIVFAIETLR